jgi:hypothetical protein
LRWERGTGPVGVVGAWKAVPVTPSGRWGKLGLVLVGAADGASVEEAWLFRDVSVSGMDVVRVISKVRGYCIPLW